MSMTQKTDDLIERLEKASAPDRELDVAIVYALYPEIGPYRPHCVGDEPIFYQDPFYKQRCPKFTASIDAAMRLVPEGWSWRVGNLPSGKGFADLGTQKSLQCIEGATPAIALCIAALRVRSPR